MSSEFPEHTPKLRVTLQRICEGASFRTSPKSCEFLRHIVGHTLSGRTDELKERLIGMSLLGRDPSYDTGSDAGVRVRANEVRKRLAAYYSNCQTPDEMYLDLPIGSYVPRFFRSVHSERDLPVPGVRAAQEKPRITPTPLSLYQLAGPTLVMLFLCIVCIRWQVAQEHPFISFWNKVFTGHNSILYLPEATYGLHASPDKSPAGGIQSSEVQAMRTAAPLLNLAGQFHTSFKIVNAPDTAAAQDSVLVTVGDSSRRSDPAFISSTGISGRTGTYAPNGWRLVLASTPQGQKIVDTAGGRGLNASFLMPSHAALLTIVNGSSPSVYIDGTDEDSINDLVELLCTEDTFPAFIRSPFQAGTVVQILFPMASSSIPLIFRQPMHGGDGSVAMGGLQ